VSFIDENVSPFFSATPRAVADLPIGRNLRAQTADNVKYVPYLDSNVPFSMEDIELLAEAMRKGGAWFFGQDVRSVEASMHAAHDIIVAADMIGYTIAPTPTMQQTEQPPPVEPSPYTGDSVGVTGQAGNSRYD